MTTPQQTSTNGARRWRGAAAAICLVLAAVLTIPAAVAFWAHRTLLETDTYVTTVTELAADEDVQAAVATVVSEAVADNLDIEAVVADTLGRVDPDPALERRVANTLEQSLPPLVRDVTGEILAAAEFQTVWADLNRTLSTALLAALSDQQSAAVQLSDGQLVLDLDPAVARVESELASRGLPTSSLRTPPGASHVVVLSSDELAQAQSIYRFADPLSQWLIVGVLALYVAAVLVSPRHRRMTGVVGGVILVLGGALVGLLLVGGRAVASRFGDPTLTSGAEVFYETVTSRLTATGWLMLLSGAGLVAAAAFAPQLSSAVRREPE